MTDQSKQYRGVPLKERAPADVRDALSGLEDAIVEPFLRLHAYAQAEHIGLSRLATQARIPSSVLSQCFNGQYKGGDYAAIAERISRFFWRLEQKAMYGGLREFKETQLAKALWAVFEKTRVIRRIQIVQGPEQVGKTRAATEYTEANNSGRTVYLKLSGGTRAGAGDFIWSLAEALNLPHSYKLREKRLLIRHALEACDLIIVDEAHLTFTWSDRSQAEFWDYLRTDVFEDGARGIVLIATNSDMLSGLQSWRKRCGYNVGQLLGRMRNEVLAIDPADDVVLEDVALMVSRYYEPGKEAMAFLHDLVTRPQCGHFGLLDDVLNEAWTLAKSRKRKLDDATVLSVARRVTEEIKQRQKLYER